MLKNWTTRIAAIGASVLLTMRIFSEPPRGRLRMANVVERVVDDSANFGLDPREVVNGRIVLTLPMDRNAPPRAVENRFGLN
jgi:hypothetical protein